MSLRVGMVAGEPSGDRLGAGLLQALAADGPVEAIGVGGAELAQVGLQSIAPMTELTMHGFVEPLRRLPRLWRLLRNIEERMLAAKVDVFVGVDFNVFNLLLERRLKRCGIATVHYVSPSVYAWRKGRVKRIAKSADLLLALFPFEPALYAGQPLRVAFVGHPMADEIEPQDRSGARPTTARNALDLPPGEPVICLMPGSRSSEIRYMLRPFLAAARQFLQYKPNARFLLPCATSALRAEVEAIALQPSYADLPLQILDDEARLALAASDAALVKSGTSTLEAMLLGVPMVVGYRLGSLSYQLIKRLIRTPFIALPNILAGRALVPELLQDAMQPTLLAAELRTQLREESRTQLLAAFADLHADLRLDASVKGAREIRGLVAGTLAADLQKEA